MHFSLKVLTSNLLWFYKNKRNYSEIEGTAEHQIKLPHFRKISLGLRNEFIKNNRNRSLF